MQIQADYKNSNISRYKNNYMNNLPKNNVSFEGLNLRSFFSRSKSSVLSENSLKEYTYQISSLLGLKFEETASKIKGLNDKSKKFLEALSRIYNEKNYSLAGNLKEDPQLVFAILNKIKHPKIYHYNVISNISESFEYISKIFSIAQDKKSMEFVLDFQKQILKNNSNSNCKNMLIEMLDSPFKQQYIKNIDDYKSYIILNRKNPEAIKELDLLLENNIYDRSVYDIRLAVKEMLSNSKLNSSKYLSQDNIEKHYSAYGTEFLNNFINEYHGMRNFSFSTKSEINAIEMYKSTTKSNLKTRLGIINKFKSTFVDNPEKTETEISAMRKLFELVDSDKHAKKFVDKFIKNGNISSIQKLNEVLMELSPQKVDIFSDNIFRIFRMVKDEELIPILKENYNNPFFETEAYKNNYERMVECHLRKSESYFSKLKRIIQNEINKFRLVIAEEKPIVEQKVPEKVENAMPFEWNTQKALPLQPQKNELPNPKAKLEIKLLPIDELLKIQKPNELPIELEHIITTPRNETPIKLTNTIKESPKARKLRLIGEVNEFISKKLSAKTIKEQEIDYRKRATKMRLKMLPEIFDSIKETRQADRAVGKLKPNSSNKDAVELYKLINGSNRKYVKYLLEKRNVDGTRMFEVKNIISMVEKANKRVDAMKKSNPDFKAKDAKAYFDHLYDSKIEQYGKVKKTKK